MKRNMKRKITTIFTLIAIAMMLAGCPQRAKKPPCIKEGESLTYGWDYKKMANGTLCPVRKSINN